MKATKFAATLLSVLFVLTSVLSVSVFADEESTPTAPAVWDGTVDTSWYDAESTSKDVTLYTPAQLAGFSELSQTNNFWKWTIRLGADMVLNTGNAAEWGTTAPANTWTPIGEFWGTFDGQGYTVSGLYFADKTKSEVGFFSSLNGGIVQNVVLCQFLSRRIPADRHGCGYHQDRVRQDLRCVFRRLCVCL